MIFDLVLFNIAILLDIWVCILRIGDGFNRLDNTLA